jgi:hypothetical protein
MAVAFCHCIKSDAGRLNNHDFSQIGIISHLAYDFVCEFALYDQKIGAGNSRQIRH